MSTSKSRIQRFLSMRTLTAASKGKIPGPEGSIGKLFGAQIMTQMGELALAIVGPAGMARADDDYRWNQSLLGAPAAHIAGGSDEVMKNIIGERVLGLPGEPRVDKGHPVEGRAALADERVADCDRSRRHHERADPEVAGTLTVDRAQHVEVAFDPVGLRARHHHAPVDQLLHVELDVTDPHRAPDELVLVLAVAFEHDVDAEAAAVPVPHRRERDERDPRARRVVERARRAVPLEPLGSVLVLEVELRSRTAPRPPDARLRGARAGRASADRSASSRAVRPSGNVIVTSPSAPASDGGRVQQLRLPAGRQHQAGGVVDDAEARGRPRSPAR